VGTVFFNLDEGKKFEVRRSELEKKTPALGAYLVDIKKRGAINKRIAKLGEQMEGNAGELSEPEKWAVGGGVLQVEFSSVGPQLESAPVSTLAPMK
jgi:hypothetical protein